MQELAYRLKEAGSDICICTSRYDDPNKLLNSDLFKVVHRLDLTEKDVIFCGGQHKYKFLKEYKDLVCHFDDDFDEVKLITEHCNPVLGVHILNPAWLVTDIIGFDMPVELKLAQFLMIGIEAKHNNLKF